jgi:hypothetical protein
VAFLRLIWRVRVPLVALRFPPCGSAVVKVRRRDRRLRLCPRAQIIFQANRLSIHARMRIADFRKALRYRDYREVSWVIVRDLVPVKRR